MIQEIHNQIGQAVTALAFLLNLIMGQDINALLTLVISVLSIVYLTLKIIREFKTKTKTRKDNED